MKKLIILIISVFITTSMISCESPIDSAKNKIHEVYMERVHVAEDYAKIIEENIDDFVAMELALSEQLDGVVIHVGSSIQLTKKKTGMYKFSVLGLDGSAKCNGSQVISADWLPENFNAIVVSNGLGEIIVAVEHPRE